MWWIVLCVRAERRWREDDYYFLPCSGSGVVEKQLGATCRKLLFKLKLISPTIFAARIHFPRSKATHVEVSQDNNYVFLSFFLCFFLGRKEFISFFCRHFLQPHKCRFQGAPKLDKALKQQLTDFGHFFFSPSATSKALINCFLTTRRCLRRPGAKSNNFCTHAVINTKGVQCSLGVSSTEPRPLWVWTPSATHWRIARRRLGAIYFHLLRRKLKFRCTCYYIFVLWCESATLVELKSRHRAKSVVHFSIVSDLVSMKMNALQSTIM